MNDAMSGPSRPLRSTNAAPPAENYTGLKSRVPDPLSKAVTMKLEGQENTRAYHHHASPALDHMTDNQKQSGIPAVHAASRLHRSLTAPQTIPAQNDTSPQPSVAPQPAWPSLSNNTPSHKPAQGSLSKQMTPSTVPISLPGCTISASDPLRVLDTLDAIFVQDTNFQELREYTLNKQLTRTKDGATDQSRIQELADLVKMLRRCVRMYQDKVVSLKSELKSQEDDVLSQIRRLAHEHAAQRAAATQGRASIAEREELIKAHASAMAAVRAEAEADLARAKITADAQLAAARADIAVQLERFASESTSAIDPRASRDEAQLLRTVCDEQRREACSAQAELQQLRAACEGHLSEAATARDELKQLRAIYEGQLRDHRVQMKDIEYSAAHHSAVFQAEIVKLQGRLYGEEVRARTVYSSDVVFKIILTSFGIQVCLDNSDRSGVAKASELQLNPSYRDTFQSTSTVLSSEKCPTYSRI